MSTQETPSSQKPRPAGRLINTEIVIAYVLRVGVISCAVIISFGVLLSWINPQSLQRFSENVLPALTAGREVTDVEIPYNALQFFGGIASLSSTTIIAFGLFLLDSSSNYARCITVVLFFLERDYTYLVITLFVLTVLLSGLFFGKAF